MFRIYEVYCGERFVGCYRALNADSAINQAYMKDGSASAYTGNAQHMYKAKELYSFDRC